MFDEQTKEKIADMEQKLKLPYGALMAVAEVESSGKTLANVRGKFEPLIRFEGHYFDRFLRGDTRLHARAEGLASPRAGAIKNPLQQSARWALLNRAIKINRIAALSSVSWGMGQVMGAHWQWLGYGSVDALVAEARSGVLGQIALMARYIEKAGLVHAIQQRDWVAFARRYNGRTYYKNKYDKKLTKAFARFNGVHEGGMFLPDVLQSQKGEGLKFGAKGPQVKAMQRALTRIGYVVVADGLFGLITDRIVRQFQRDHLLEDNGIWGSKEQRLISESLLDLSSLVPRAAVRSIQKTNKVINKAFQFVTDFRKKLKGVKLFAFLRDAKNDHEMR